MLLLLNVVLVAVLVVVIVVVPALVVFTVLTTPSIRTSGLRSDDSAVVLISKSTLIAGVQGGTSGPMSPRGDPVVDASTVIG